MNLRHSLLPAAYSLLVAILSLLGAPLNGTEVRELVLVAGKPSHPARMHEFNAGVQLLAKCLQDVPGLNVDIVLNGWPSDLGLLERADAVVFYMDGGSKHEVVQDGERRLRLVDTLAKRGAGLGFMHYGVEVTPDRGGAEFKRWIGGHYEHMHSCNPIWEPSFARFPEHPATRGVKPFAIKDEWYFNIRFVSGLAGDRAGRTSSLNFLPLLVASPTDAVRDGPYVHPKGPYGHIQSAKGRAEAMMWVVERNDGGRGFGFTGGHFHDNWGNDEFRKVVLNTLVWLSGVEVPERGLPSRVTASELDANLDPKDA
jgi:hypothetical protein